MLRASVVIPTFNRSRDLEECLVALTNQTLPRTEFEVVVADDGSTDGTTQVIEKFEKAAGSNVRGFRQDNRGPAAARNLGVERARADLVAFTDDDCLPEPGWLEQMIAALPGVSSGVGGSVVRHRERFVGRFMDHVGVLLPATRGGEVLWLVTANALFRTSAVREVGGFDTRFTWPGGEDPDLGDRLRASGHSLARTERAVVRHKHRDSVRGLFNTYRLYGRGEAARSRLGRTSGLWHRSSVLFLIVCIGHWGVHAVRLLFSTRIRMADRLGFPFLRAIANAGLFVGFVTCPQLKRR